MPNLEDIQIALFDMYDLRTALRSVRDKPLCEPESEETIGGCVDGVIQLLESLEAEIEGQLLKLKTR
jgi:hypothetical protein